jgi:hypothetical protein
VTVCLATATNATRAVIARITSFRDVSARLKASTTLPGLLAGDGAATSPCRGRSGAGTSTSGVVTIAVSRTGLPQPGQNRSPGLNSFAQFLQYLSAIILSQSDAYMLDTNHSNNSYASHLPGSQVSEAC